MNKELKIVSKDEKTVVLSANVELECPPDIIMMFDKSLSKEEQAELGVCEKRTTLFHNFSTGKTSTDFRSVTRDGVGYHIMNKCDMKEKGFFAVYLPNLDAVLLTVCGFNKKRNPLKNEILNMEVEKYYLFFRGRAVYETKQRVSYEYDSSKRLSFAHVNDDFKTFTFSKSFGYNSGVENKWGERINAECSNTRSAFGTLFGEVVPVSGNRVISWKSFNEICMFGASTQVKKKTGPKQALIDKLTSCELPNAKPYGFKNKYATICKVEGYEDEPVCAIRTYYNDETAGTFESARMYVGKTIFIACKDNGAGEWVQMPLNAKRINHWNFGIDDFDKEAVVGTKLEYFGSIMDEIPFEQRGFVIWAFLMHPILEKMYKAGFNKYFQCQIEYCAQYGYAIDLEKNLRSNFGMYNTKKKKLSSVLGINQHQLKMVLAEMDELAEKENLTDCINLKELSIGYIKKIINSDFSNEYVDISSMDDQTFDALHGFVYHWNTVSRESEQNNYRTRRFRSCLLREVLPMLYSLYGMKTVVSMLPSLNEVTFRDCKRPYLEMYKDYLIGVTTLNEPHRYKAQFSLTNLNSITQMHNEVVAVVNIRNNEVKIEQWNERASFWKKWEFEDGDYIVVAPTNPSELGVEGINLHHCVKSYVDRVANGVTNIMFIRKREEPDIPFFTVEVSNDNSIEQIHGFANRNMDTEPDMIPFVTKWASQKKLKLHTVNKVR
jgi:hypothetical protein